MKRRFDMKVALNVFLICLFSFLMVSVDSAFGKNIAGVDVPQSVTIENSALVLNGAGIRKKLFIKVYVGSLYLSAKQTTVDNILADPGAKSIVMNFLYKEVSTKKLVDGWNKGFTDNSSSKELKALQERINQFNSLFTTVYKGDEIRLDYLPGEGTQVRLNGTLKGSVPGEDFYRALLKIWLGSKPADDGLMKAWLGK
ncbi:chalcone isomerase family protein [Thermodesulfobacteriota bacterium]